MITWQNCVYILHEVRTEHDGVDFICGVYQNFEQAYRHLEDITNGRPIIDCGDNILASVFETIDIKKGILDDYSVITQRYAITRDLLSVHSNERLVTPEMIRTLKAENKERNRNSKYRLKAEVL